MDNLSSRIIELRGSLSRRAFGEQIGTTESTLRNYEKGTSLPDAQFLKDICQKLHVSPRWLLLGTGPKQDIRTIEYPLPPEGPTATPSTPQSHDRCVELEEELKVERKERRELADENRQLHRDKETLLRENGELREKVARLEERKRRYEITHGLYVEDDSRV
ncbi:MAG TPA: helix-turn-helix domain-containing protein [Candidatus Mailhella excrementigallinarum]|nr:helix-turn-helix domain-containing protein [Candidatus Mailhella excrementigallinarum]